MNDFDTKNYFTDPHPFSERHRSMCQYDDWKPPPNVIAVTGYDEALAVLRDTAHFSKIVAPIGPFPP